MPEEVREERTYGNKPNFKVCGPILGKNIKLFQDIVKNYNFNIIKSLEEGSDKEEIIDNNIIKVTYDMLDIRLNSKEGFNASNEGNNFIILNTILTKELLDEGIVREFISKVQQIRKINDYEMMDKIYIYYSENYEFDNAIKEYIEFIKKETLAIQLIKSNGIFDERYNINGIELGIRLEKEELK